MKSLEELAAIRDKMKNIVNTREAGENNIRIAVGMATCGIAAGARPVLNAFTEEVARRELSGVTVTQTGCIGICQYEPVVEVFVPGQEKVTYVKMTPEKVGPGRRRAHRQRKAGRGVHHRRGPEIKEGDAMFRCHVMVCGGTGCTSSGSAKIMEAFEREIAINGLDQEVKVIHTGCFGLCALGPIVVVYPEGCFYSRVKEEDVGEIVREHLLKGRPVTRLLYEETVDQDQIKSLSETNFYKKAAPGRAAQLRRHQPREYRGVHRL